MKSKQEKIVNQFVKDVPKFGWSRDTLLGSAKNLKISTSILAKEFPNFESDILKFIISKNNNSVEKSYKSFNHERLRMILAPESWVAVSPINPRCVERPLS